MEEELLRSSTRFSSPQTTKSGSHTFLATCLSAPLPPQPPAMTADLRKRSFTMRLAKKGKTRPEHGSLELECLDLGDMGEPVVCADEEEGFAAGQTKAVADKQPKDAFERPNLTQEQAIIAKDRCWLGWLSFWLLGTGVLFPCESSFSLSL